MRARGWVAAAVAGGASAAALGGGGGAPMLPDLITREAELYDHDFVSQDGRVYLRLANGTPNVGAGPLHLYGSTVHGDGTRDVMQRVLNSDGSFTDRLAGRFTHHAGHPHLHVDGWTAYRLREVEGKDGVGAVVAQTVRTSGCIIDLFPHDLSLPGAPGGPEFGQCESATHGVSVGWMNYDAKAFANQRIDVTGVPPGVYWLESEVDPLDAVLEADETNNAARILVTIGTPEGIPPDACEPNDSRAQTDAQPIAGPGPSANLGPCAPVRTVAGLTVHRAGDEDFFRFYAPGVGGAGDFVRIDFSHAAGDLDLILADAWGNTVGSSLTTENFERVSLEGRPPGWYYARVRGFSNATSPSYMLTIDPPSNGAPSGSIIAPGADGAAVFRGAPYTIRWTASDPETDPLWVTLRLSETPEPNGPELLIEGSIRTDAALGEYTFQTADVPEGTYWVRAEVTDGGTVVGVWSAGTLRIAPPCPFDFNGNGTLDLGDFSAFRLAYLAGDLRADVDGDAELTLGDFSSFRNGYIAGCAP